MKKTKTIVGKILKPLKGLDRYKILTLLPIILCGLFIILFTVNSPLLDQWETVPLIQRFNNGQIPWSEIWQQHNEHRIPIPNIIILLSAIVTKWNLIIEALLGFIVAIISFVMLIKIIIRMHEEIGTSLHKWILPVLSFIWFSMVQFENWLWGWQLGWFLLNLGLLISIYGLVLIKKRVVPRNAFIFILSGVLLAQFSLGNGAVLWPLIVVILIIKKVSFSKVLLPILLISCVANLFYYNNYSNPANSSNSLILHQPVLFINYLLTFIGRPLSHLNGTAQIAGLLLLICFIVTHVFIWKFYRKKFEQLSPILMLGWFAIGSAVITAYSRMSFGTSQAFSSRYVTVSMLLTICLVIVFSLTQNETKRILVIRKLFSKLLLTIFILATGINYALSTKTALIWRDNRLKTKQCMQIDNPTDECLLRTYPNSEIVRTRAKYIKQKRIGGY